MELGHLPVIDWELGIKLAGNKRDLAEEMLALLTNSLDKDLRTISQLHANENYTDLLRRIHRLHGALCYCGLPRLKLVVANLETKLKSNIMVGLPPLLEQLEAEVSLLLKHYSPKVS